MKLFTSILTNARNKLECLSLVSVYSLAKFLWVKLGAYPNEEAPFRWGSWLYPQTLDWAVAIFLVVCDPSKNELWVT